MFKFIQLLKADTAKEIHFLASFIEIIFIIHKELPFD